MSEYIALYNETEVTAETIDAIDLNISGSLSVDTINEYTSNHGVTVDGVNFKDGLINDTAYTAGLLMSDSNGLITSSYTIPANISTLSVTPSANLTYNIGHTIVRYLTGYINNIISSTVTTDSLQNSSSININCDLIPTATSTYNLGSSTYRFGNNYSDYIYLRQLLDKVDPNYYNILMDSTNSRIRFSVGSGYIDFSFGATANISTPNLYINSLSTGVAHVGVSGLISSSSIVNSDVDGAAAIAYSKLALTSSVKAADINAEASTNGQLLTSNGSGGASWTTVTGTNANTITLAAGAGTTNYIPFSATATGNSALLTDTDLTYNASTNVLNTTVTNSNNSYLTNVTTSAGTYQYLTFADNTGVLGDGYYPLKYTYDVPNGKYLRYDLINGILDLGGDSRSLNGRAEYTQSDSSSIDTNAFVVLRNDTNNLYRLKHTSSLKFNEGTSTLTCTNFAGKSTTCTLADEAVQSQKVKMSAGSATTNYLCFTATATGHYDVLTDTDLKYNASTNQISVGGAIIDTLIGQIIMWSTATAPTNYLLCNGASLSRATYAALFAVIGTAYGNVDANTFNVPDLLGRVPIGAGSGSGLTTRTFPTTAANSKLGAETVTLATTDIPSHTHAHTLATNVSISNSTLQARGTGSSLWNAGTAGGTNSTITVTNGAMTGAITATAAASTNPSIVPPSTIITYCIKYQ